MCLLCPLDWGGDGAKDLSGHVRKESKFFLSSPFTLHRTGYEILTVMKEGSCFCIT